MMNSTDQTLLKLADPTARPTLLQSEQLLEIAATAYEIDPDLVVGPTTAVYDKVDLALPSPGPDAVWVGSVVVRVGSGSGVIAAAEVADQGRNGHGADTLAVTVTFSAPPAVDQDTAPTVLPVIVAFVVASPDASPKALLQQSQTARQVASHYAITAPPRGAPNVRFDRVVCWVLSQAAFDDTGWPGGGPGDAAQKRAARLSAARLWLADQGIALVTTSPP
ncbi:hypothetical protein [Mycobacterium sp.]|uniref:hypothetical protein n=1 Tax=Mycobacterium sp. TaxID=1785 RepID=UPI003D0DFA64